jgi:hypothetical protein
VTPDNGTADATTDQPLPIEDWPMVGLSAVAITVSAACLPALSVAFVRWRADRITKEITQNALPGCPPSERADILRASAELASNLDDELFYSDRFPSSPSNRRVKPIAIKELGSKSHPRTRPRSDSNPPAGRNMPRWFHPRTAVDHTSCRVAHSRPQASAYISGMSESIEELTTSVRGSDTAPALFPFDMIYPGSAWRGDRRARL